MAYDEAQMDAQCGMLGNMSGGADVVVQTLQNAADDDGNVTRAILHSLSVHPNFFKGLIGDGTEQDGLHTSRARKAGLNPKADRATVKIPWQLAANIMMNQNIMSARSVEGGCGCC